MDCIPYEECEFLTRLGKIRGKRWGREGGKPVLALHGWLDNSASFDVLAPLLEGVDLIALDLMGHGLSDFRHGVGPYNIWDDLHDIYAVVRNLGWREFSVLGHSKGAMLGMLMAGTFPDMVTQLVCLDALYPQPVSSAKAPEQLAAAITSAAKYTEEKKNIYRSLEDAALARCDGLFKLSRDDALILAQRGVAITHGAYSWRYDPRLLLPSDVKFTREQLKGFLSRVQIQVLLLMAKDGVAGAYKEDFEEIMRIPFIECHTLSGGQHFHMVENAETVSEYIANYFNGKNTAN